MQNLVLIFVMLFLFSCSSESNSGPSIKGEFDKAEENTKVFLGELSEGKTLILDTAVVKKKKFKINLPQVEEPALYTLFFEKPFSSKRLYVINENASIQLKIHADSLNSSQIKGGSANLLLAEYMEKLNLGERELRKLKSNYSDQELRTPRVRNQINIKNVELNNRNTIFRRQFIDEHPDQPVSLLVYADLIDMRTAPLNEMQRLYNKLSPELKETGFGKQLAKDFKNTDPLAIGNIAPTFSAPTPEGNILALEDALGKYTLIDFWAAWCGPCRRENPNLVRIYNQYHEKGFNILGVSLDRNEQSWKRAIEQDGLIWDQISNLSFWNDPIARQYKIRSIPASLLLDEEGRIIAKNLRGRSLELKIKELLDP